MPAGKVSSKNPQIQAAIEARRSREAARKKQMSNKKQPASKPAERTKGITNIIRKRSTQAMRVANKQARGK